MLLRNVIGAALRRIRQDEGRTLREVASMANISMPYLSEIERGRKEPSSEILAGICAALGLTVLDLLHEATVEGRSAEAIVVDLTAPVAALTSLRGGSPQSDPTRSVRIDSDSVQLAVAA
jgi:transcriptional regulator with XRE-family HTH domain